MVMLPHLIWTMCFSSHCTSFQPFSYVTSLHHCVISIFCAAFVLNCIHLCLFTDVLCLALLPPAYPFLLLTKVSPSSLYHVNPSVSFSLISTLHCLILVFNLPIFSSSMLCLSCLVISASE